MKRGELHKRKSLAIIFTFPRSKPSPLTGVRQGGSGLGALTYCTAHSVHSTKTPQAVPCLDGPVSVEVTRLSQAALSPNPSGTDKCVCPHMYKLTRLKNGLANRGKNAPKTAIFLSIGVHGPFEPICYIGYGAVAKGVNLSWHDRLAPVYCPWITDIAPTLII